MWLLNLLLQSQELKPALGIKILGYFFLMLSGLVGPYFLFQALTLWMGRLESGGIVSGILAILGICFLFIEKKPKPSLQEEASCKLLNFIKDVELDKILKDNAVPLSLFFLGIGFILSQIKDPKKLIGIYRMLK